MQNPVSLPPDTPPATTSRRVHHGRGPLVHDESDDESILSTTTKRISSFLTFNRPGTDRCPPNTQRYSRFNEPESNNKRISWIQILTSGSIVLFALALFVFAVVHMYIGHLVKELEEDHTSFRDKVARSLSLSVDNLEILGPEGDAAAAFKSDSVVIKISGQIGMDARQFLGWEKKGKQVSMTPEYQFTLFPPRFSTLDQTTFLDKLDVWAVKTAVSALGSVAVAFDSVTIHDLDTNVSIVRIEEDTGVENPLIVPLTFRSTSHPEVDLSPFKQSFSVHLPGATDGRLKDWIQNVSASGKWAVTTESGPKGVVVQPGSQAKGNSISHSLARFLSMPAFNIISPISPSGIHLNGTIPNLPSSPLSDYYTINNISVTSPPNPENYTDVQLSAEVTIKNILARLPDSGLEQVGWKVPWYIPLDVWLPINQSREDGDLNPIHPAKKNNKRVPVARLLIPPIEFSSGADSVDLVIKGSLTGLNTTDEKGTMKKALNSFMKTWMAGQNASAIVTYDSERADNEAVVFDAIITEAIKSQWWQNWFPNSQQIYLGREGNNHGLGTTKSLATTQSQTFPPRLISGLLSSYEFQTQLKGNGQKVDLVRNLRVQDLSFNLPEILSKLKGDATPQPDLTCSGKILGEIVLPNLFLPIKSLIDVESVLPDVYIYDGALPTGPTDIYPPMPMPANAFARLVPTDKMASITYPDDADNTTLHVSAEFSNAPIYLLPGRADVFRRFIGKIVFGSKTKVGVRGIANVGVALGGWGAFSTEDIQVQGEFMVGIGDGLP